MEQTKEQILDEAIERMQAGLSPNALVFGNAHTDSGITSLLEVVASLQDIPTLHAPSPRIQRRYLVPHKKQSFMAGFIPLLRVGLIPLLLLIALFTGQATASSLPGQKLFTLKKMIESLHLALIRNPDSKAQVQLQLSQQRLVETEAILNATIKNPQLEAAALNELTNQNKNTLATIKVLATTQAREGKNSDLLNSLEDINKKQAVLLNTITVAGTSSTTTQDAVASNEETKVAVEEIRKIIATAHEQTLANLNPNAVSVQGLVSAIDKNKITVEKTTFTISETTIIKRGGDTVPYSSIVVQAKVSVTGTKKDGEIIADEIVILELPKLINANVKSSTTKPSSTPAAAALPEAAPEPDPNTTKTGFILEDPAPQFVP